jgi:hypothetical protein
MGGSNDPKEDEARSESKVSLHQEKVFVFAKANFGAASGKVNSRWSGIGYSQSQNITVNPSPVLFLLFHRSVFHLPRIRLTMYARFSLEMPFVKNSILSDCSSESSTCLSIS